MDLVHQDHPGKRLRLAYCLNMHAAEDLDSALANMREITVPLRERLAPGRPFGVGMYLPAPLARELREEQQGSQLRRLDEFLREHELLPFTYNAFPYGSFQTDGLKAGVYAPTWAEEARARFTLDVAHIARHLAKDRDLPRISISTHPGGFSTWVRSEQDLEDYARGFLSAVSELERLEGAPGTPEFVLALEAEPRASCNDGTELMPFLERLRGHAAQQLDGGEATARRLLGVCLDTCHAAVEFEQPDEAWSQATAEGGALGKIQFSSALALREPADDPAARELLLGLDEPRFLHQVTGRRTGRQTGSADLVRASDLPEVARSLEDDPTSPWLDCEEWRCHFHVPVDRERIEGESAGLDTTREFADQLLAQALQDPGSWSTPELQVEIETYTWSVLPGSARGPGDLLSALEREYRHVLSQTERHGWHLPA